MKIAMLASIEETVPPTRYGGTELVIANLIQGLQKQGHEVTLFGAGNSAVSCPIVPLVDRAIREIPPFDHDLSARSAAKYHAISKILSSLGTMKFDIIHNHIGPRLLLFSDIIHQPMVTTLHLPSTDGERRFGLWSAPFAPLVSISNAQRVSYPEGKYVATVYNGIDCSLFPFSKDIGEYVMFLGRFTREKGVEQAIEVAKRTGKHLVIGAKVDEVDREYFRSVSASFDPSFITFVGEMDFTTKTKYLSGAYALLAPIQWDEPFGLYVVEAMACGTPVLGMKRGSFPEIIEHGKTGFLSSTVDEMAKQVALVPTIDRAYCREVVQHRFSIETMTAGYEAVYAKVLERKGEAIS